MERFLCTVRRPTTLLFCLLAIAFQHPHFKVSASSSPDDRATYVSCRHCGMDRTQFAHSRLLITYTDGTVAAVCSMHCAALDLALNIGRQPRLIQVGDYRTRELIPAESSPWVLGGKKPGVMSRRAKWAFADPRAAHDFIQEHGGIVTDFSEALKASYADMYDDVAMLRKKRSTR